MICCLSEIQVEVGISYWLQSYTGNTLNRSVLRSGPCGEEVGLYVLEQRPLGA